MLYFVAREGTAALGLMSLGGHAQTVRPLLAPMAEGAALNEYGELPQTIRDKIKAHAAACDNIAVFFGEDIFIAFGAVLLIDAFLKENGIEDRTAAYRPVGHSDRYCGTDHPYDASAAPRRQHSSRRDGLESRAGYAGDRTMMTLITINRVYYLIGFVVMLLVVMTLRDRANPKRYTTALFWFLFGGIFLFGDLMVQELGKSLAYRIIGGAVIVIALLAGFGLVGKGHYKMSTEEERVTSSHRLKNWLFLPALMIPVVTVIGTLFLKGVSIGGVYLLDQKQLTLAALCVACVAAILTGWWLTKGTPLHAVRQSRRLVDTIGWAVILPQMLAMLGGVFVVANTGESVQKVVSLFVNPDSRFMLVVIYCVGMALFTMIMGNAFAAFPVLSAGIALPFLINVHHGNPAPLLAIGMYAGYCGTLMTPMAANFNIVPAALLELKDKYQVIKIQIPTALTLLVVNVFLMYFLVFR